MSELRRGEGKRDGATTVQLTAVVRAVADVARHHVSPAIAVRRFQLSLPPLYRREGSHLRVLECRRHPHRDLSPSLEPATFIASFCQWQSLDLRRLGRVEEPLGVTVPCLRCLYHRKQLLNPLYWIVYRCLHVVLGVRACFVLLF
ncbi:uncharacterized protein LOC127741675 [Arachis duranensis]|uniref:Uncharacterized protein LOC127741675 n=1 Tax=Arachis duranensis TaxID=130453 RepID=A0A9C6TI04_ARADU|nr:uncharacterized protein LOC127741675 [Arachis duranensis]